MVVTSRKAMVNALQGPFQVSLDRANVRGLAGT